MVLDRFSNGLALCALVHSQKPSLFDFASLQEVLFIPIQSLLITFLIFVYFMIYSTKRWTI